MPGRYPDVIGFSRLETLILMNYAILPEHLRLPRIFSDSFLVRMQRYGQGRRELS